MKKSNVQAELLSRPGQAPRHSPAHAHFFEQNYSADQSKLHATHLLTSIFFSFFVRLQAQAHSRPGGPPRNSPAHFDFFFFFS